MKPSKITYQSSNKKRNEQFIYQFSIGDVKTKKEKIDSCIIFFNKFLSYYKKKFPSFKSVLVNSLKKKDSIDKRLFFIHLFTIPSNNHPFLIFGLYKSNLINIMIPMGGDRGQFDIGKVRKNLSSLSTLEKLGLFHQLTTTIKLREVNFINYSKKYLVCNNITRCIEERKVKRINNVVDLNKLNKKYTNDIMHDIKNFISLIKKGEYTLAKNFITKNSKNHICLEKKLINSKDTIGHLLIFIDVYKTLQQLKTSV